MQWRKSSHLISEGFNPLLLVQWWEMQINDLRTVPKLNGSVIELLWAFAQMIIQSRWYTETITRQMDAFLCDGRCDEYLHMTGSFFRYIATQHAYGDPIDFTVQFQFMKERGDSPFTLPNETIAATVRQWMVCFLFNASRLMQNATFVSIDTISTSDIMVGCCISIETNFSSVQKSYQRSQRG